MNFTKKNKYILSAICFFFLLSILKIFQLFFGETKSSTESSKFFRVVSISIPKNLNFAGENVPLHNPKVVAILKNEFNLNGFWGNQVKLFYQRAHYWFPVIEPILKRENIPDDFKYLAVVESGLVNNLVSRSGASGFWQFIPSTAIKYGLEINENVDERFDVEKSTIAACRYFKEAYKTLGSYTLVAASYNLGINGMVRRINEQGNENYYDLILNKETSKYLFRALAAKSLLQNPKKYGFYIKKSELINNINVKNIYLDTLVNNLDNFSSKNKITKSELLLFNPWITGSEILGTKKKKRKIKIPNQSNYKQIISNFGFLFQNKIYPSITNKKASTLTEDTLIIPLENEQVPK